jgi:sugar phosphate permease
MTASNATGQLVFLPLLATLTEVYGWRTALTFVTVVIVAAMLLVLLLMRDYPSDVGLPAYGDKTVNPPPARNTSFAQLALSPLAALRDASKTATFWVLFGTFFVCGLSTNGLIQTHWISICGDFGIAPVSAAGTLAVIGIFDFIGTVFAGWLSDRYDNRWLLFWFYGLRDLSLVYLSLSGFSVVELSVFAVFYGLDWVATIPPTVRLTGEAFGRENTGVVYGWIGASHQLGASMAAFAAGAIRSQTGDYRPAFLIAGALCLIAGSSFLIAGRRALQAPAVIPSTA